MFQLHIAYSFELLVLAAGIVLIYFGTRQNSQLLKIGGYILTILTVLNIACTAYYGIRYWQAGYYKNPLAPAAGMMGMMPGMMEGGMGMMGKDGKGMMCGEMMKKMMGEQKGMGSAPAPTSEIPAGVSPEDHEAHH